MVRIISHFTCLLLLVLIPCVVLFGVTALICNYSLLKLVLLIPLFVSLGILEWVSSQLYQVTSKEEWNH